MASAAAGQHSAAAALVMLASPAEFAFHRHVPLACFQFRLALAAVEVTFTLGQYLAQAQCLQIMLVSTHNLPHQLPATNATPMHAGVKYGCLAPINSASTKVAAALKILANLIFSALVITPQPPVVSASLR